MADPAQAQTRDGRPRILADASKDSLGPFATATTEPKAIVHTDGLASYRTLAKLGYDHRPRPQHTATPDEQLLPRTAQSAT